MVFLLTPAKRDVFLWRRVRTCICVLPSLVTEPHHVCCLMELQDHGDLMGPLQVLPVQTSSYDSFLLPNPNKAVDTFLRMLLPKFSSEEDSFYFQHHRHLTGVSFTCLSSQTYFRNGRKMKESPSQECSPTWILFQLSLTPELAQTNKLQMAQLHSFVLWGKDQEIKKGNWYN